MESDLLAMNYKTQYCYDVSTTQRFYRFNAILIKFQEFFAYTEKPILKFIQNLKGPWIAKIILETTAIPSHISWFQNLLQSYSNQNSMVLA